MHSFSFKKNQSFLLVAHIHARYATAAEFAANHSLSRQLLVASQKKMRLNPSYIDITRLLCDR